jgi:hypothetical protein
VYLPSTHSGEYFQHTGYDSYHASASKVKEEAMFERTNAHKDSASLPATHKLWWHRVEDTSAVLGRSH